MMSASQQLSIATLPQPPLQQQLLVCPVCAHRNEFMGAVAMERHLALTHYKCQPYSCNSCLGEARFHSEAALRSHYREDHGVVEFDINFHPSDQELFHLEQIAKLLNTAVMSASTASDSSSVNTANNITVVYAHTRETPQQKRMNNHIKEEIADSTETTPSPSIPRAQQQNRSKNQQRTTTTQPQEHLDEMWRNFRVELFADTTTAAATTNATARSTRRPSKGEGQGEAEEEHEQNSRGERPSPPLVYSRKKQKNLHQLLLQRRSSVKRPPPPQLSAATTQPGSKDPTVGMSGGSSGGSGASNNDPQQEIKPKPTAEVSQVAATTMIAAAMNMHVHVHERESGRQVGKVEQHHQATTSRMGAANTHQHGKADDKKKTRGSEKKKKKRGSEVSTIKKKSSKKAEGGTSGSGDGGGGGGGESFCTVCKKRLNDKKSQAYKHINHMHLKITTHQCLLCGKMFADFHRRYIINHLRSAHATVLGSDAGSDELSRHISVLESNRKRVVELAAGYLGSKPALTKSSRSNTTSAEQKKKGGESGGKKCAKCTFCGKRLTKKCLFRHINQSHLKITTHECLLCGSKFADYFRDNVVRHLRSAHASQLLEQHQQKGSGASSSNKLDRDQLGLHIRVLEENIQRVKRMAPTYMK